MIFSDVKDMTDDALYHLLFPGKHCSEKVFEKWDMEYIHKELGRFGVNLKLLHAEYVDECSRKKAIPMGYSKFCRDYKSYTIQPGFSRKVIHT